MNKHRKLFYSLLTLSIILMSIVAEAQVKIGVIAHLSGDFAQWGQAYVEGIQLAQEQINSSGGIKQTPVQIVFEDSQFNLSLTAAASSKLLNIDKISAGLISTFTEVMVAGPLFEKAQIPLLVFGDSGGQIETIGEYVFSSGTWVDGYAFSASEYLADQEKMKRVAVFATNNPWSQSVANNFSIDFQKKGGEIILRVDQNPSETDFRTILSKIKRYKVEAIFAPITAGIIPFFQQARQLKLEMPIIAAGGALDVDVIQAAPSAVEGRYVTNSFLDSKRSEASKFLSDYQAKFGKSPRYPSVSARGYDGLMTLVKAMQQAQDRNSESIQKSLLALEFDGAGFKIEFDSNRTARLPVKVLQVKNGVICKVGDC